MYVLGHLVSKIGLAFASMLAAYGGNIGGIGNRCAFVEMGDAWSVKERPPQQALGEFRYDGLVYRIVDAILEFERVSFQVKEQ